MRKALSFLFSVAKGMGARTNISETELDILSRYFQYNAKDMNK